MKKWSKDQLIASLQKEGLYFSDFSLVHEGGYTVDDADWNYKDVPHLHHIHQLVEAIFAVMQDDLIATINVQKILGIKFPLAVVNYESGKNEQTYYTTLFFFVLIVQTRFEQTGPCQTRVTTTYSIGSPWLLKWCVPIIRFLIKRNYNDLMSGDIPMRERRGNLRKQGYSFHKETESYSFPKTMEILKTNVITPKYDPFKMTLVISEVLPQDGEYFYGQDNHLGLRLIRLGSKLSIFPRMCLHEGASLDASKCVNMQVKCPWHGRQYSPIATFDLNAAVMQTVKTDKFNFELSNKTLTIMDVNIVCPVLES